MLGLRFLTIEVCYYYGVTFIPPFENSGNCLKGPSPSVIQNDTISYLIGAR